MIDSITGTPAVPVPSLGGRKIPTYAKKFAAVGGEMPKYRSRLVAKEFNTGVNHDLYAATPPSECLRLMLSLLASGRSKGVTLMYADVSRAYFYAKARRDVYIKLPAEDSEEGMCGKLDKAMYGTRDAAQNWEEEYSETLIAIGFSRG